jgi:phospholipid/cholesterol/gamma-HCH transport system substrate-binding protein
MDSTYASKETRFKVGIFTIIGVIFIGIATVYVNDKPQWWRPCQYVKINVEDASGLKAKSAIKSLGIEIGYLSSVELTESHVILGICITAPVEVLPTTRAYIRSEGFLGDKYVELKPVKYTGPKESKALAIPMPWDLFVTTAHAAPKSAAKNGREIPVGESSQDVQHLVNRVDDLVHEITDLTNNIKVAIHPEELRSTLRQLNTTLKNASTTFAPEGGLNQTAQRSLAKLEDAIEQMRDIISRVNRGEGSVGMLLNDPSYAEELKEAAKNVNRMLSKVGGVRFIVDIGAQKINNLGSSSGGRGSFSLAIWPRADRYYLVGLTIDPRGRRSSVITTTTAGGSSITNQSVQIDETAFLLTVMVGKTFLNRISLAVGALYGDGAISAGLLLGPHNNENMIDLRGDAYTRVGTNGIDGRATLTLRPMWGVYLQGGVESIQSLGSSAQYFAGAGIAFDDEDIKILFALK